MGSINRWFPEGAEKTNPENYKDANPKIVVVTR